MTPLVFDVAGRKYRMSVPAIVAFKIQVRENRYFSDLCGCDGCGVVCFTGFPCACEGHYRRRALGEDEYANHRFVAAVPDVLTRITQLYRSSS